MLNNTNVSRTGAAIGGNVETGCRNHSHQGGNCNCKNDGLQSRGAAIGASAGKSVEEIRISGGVVTAKGSWGAGIGTGSADSRKEPVKS